MYKLIKALKIFSRPVYAANFLRHRVAASVEHEAALQGLGCKTVVDIGANRGQFALAARASYPHARIVAFEPLPGPARVFRQVFANEPQVSLHEAAVGPEAVRVDMHVSARDDSSSLLPIGREQTRIFPGTEEAGTAPVDVRRLEEVLHPEEIVSPALLKLDVQGFELEALRGCEPLLELFSWVYCECSFRTLYEGQALADDVIAWLRGHGLKLIGVYNLGFDKDGKAVQADFMFERAAV